MVDILLDAVLVLLSSSSSHHHHYCHRHLQVVSVLRSIIFHHFCLLVHCLTIEYLTLLPIEGVSVRCLCIVCVYLCKQINRWLVNSSCCLQCQLQLVHVCGLRGEVMMMMMMMIVMIIVALVGIKNNETKANSGSDL